MKTKPKSSCCQAKVEVVGGDEGTMHYECSACHRSCHIYEEPKTENWKEEVDKNHDWWNTQCPNCGDWFRNSLGLKVHLSKEENRNMVGFKREWEKFKSVFLGRHSSLWAYGKQETIGCLDNFFYQKVKQAKQEGIEEVLTKIDNWIQMADKRPLQMAEFFTGLGVLIAELKNKNERQEG